MANISKEELNWQTRELSLYIDNDYPMYVKKIAWFKNMWKKYRAGKFNPLLAEVGFGNLTTEAARKYNRENFGADKIGTDARKLVNKELVVEFLSAIQNKEYDFMI